MKDRAAREWYAKANFEQGWSRNVLVHRIEGGAHKLTGAALTNFKQTLPPAQSELAQQITNDPYTFDSLAIGEDVHEQELE